MLDEINLLKNEDLSIVFPCFTFTDLLQMYLFYNIDFLFNKNLFIKILVFMKYHS